MLLLAMLEVVFTSGLDEETLVPGGWSGHGEEGWFWWPEIASTIYSVLCGIGFYVVKILCMYKL